MKKYFYTVLLIVSFTNLFAQTKVNYLNKFMFPTSQEGAIYYETVEYDTLNNLQKSFVYRTKDSTLYMKGTYQDKYKHGEFITYYSNQQIESKGFYTKGKKTGLWETWYKNGQAQFQMLFPSEKSDVEGAITINPEDFMNAKVTSFWDSTGKQSVKQGNGELSLYYGNQQKKISGKMLTGFSTGEWTGWKEDGKLYYKEEYNNGKFIKGVSYDSTGKEYPYTEFGTPAESQGGIKGFYEFVGKNMVYPKSARKAKIEGKVIIEMVVNQEGRLGDFKILKSAGEILDEEAIRVLQLVPAWKPGVQRGQKVKQRMTIPITFKL
jgi:TonB family protein